VRADGAEGRGRIGLVVNLEPKYAATDRPEDTAARDRADAYMNRQFLDPALLGRYPPELRGIFREAWPEELDREAEGLREPLDYLGINYYKRNVVRDAPELTPVREGSVRQPRSTHTELGWEVCPEALTDVLLWVTERYGRMPLYITENGAAFYDPPTAGAEPLEDPLRVRYLTDHVSAAHAAMLGGADLRGYFAWSLLDNFEWGAGFSKRFGLIHVDLQTQRRTLKRSALAYAELIRAETAPPAR
jgi:beta-glucosidase